VPVLASLFFSLALGVALSRRLDALGRGARARARHALGVAAAYGGLVVLPVVAYPALFFPDWAYGYRVDGARVPSAISLTLALASAALVPLGFWLGARAALASASSRVVAGLAALVLSGVVALAPHRALFADDATARVVAGYELAPLFPGPLGGMLVVSLVLAAVGFMVAARGLGAGARAAAPPSREPPRSRWLGGARPPRAAGRG
jgi:hypothetical protein